ncbi:zinc transporter, ZIP family [Caloramator quimbayensis]|uniref:Zinc transporter ZupT n=1 Tax=Caloramator quimbayensis TaxID=1147123 RepID=A0A1T4XVQ5_9CLOT|nr:zinc transporter ZupT [Caloramator quimbayensis]SKA93155.1 zinc transporter, ZIP family [Caloramator quimbayensis]
MWKSSVSVAFLLTLLAGLSTGIGSALAFFTKKTNKKYLSISLGFSAGVMIYVSFVEILQNSRDMLIKEKGIVLGNWICVLSFFGGMLLITLIDKFVPSFENPHSVHKVEDIKDIDSTDKLLKLGILTAVAIAIHNFPEGISTFAASLKSLHLGLPIAAAIAIHNIPEGIAVSMPLYYATGSRKKAFFYSFLSGLSEPLGGLIGYIFLLRYLNDVTFGIIFGIVAGIMVFISFDELLPAAQEYGEHHLSVYGLISGMVVMALSLLLFTNC